MKLRKNQTTYDFSKPIHILEYKNPGLDIMFYAAGLSICVALIFVLLCFHNGHFVLKFTFWRTLLSLPLILLAILFTSLLKELSIYPQILLKKSTWTLPEMMQLTNKNQQETQRIMTRVLESCFIVAEGSSKNR